MFSLIQFPKYLFLCVACFGLCWKAIIASVRCHSPNTPSGVINTFIVTYKGNKFIPFVRFWMRPNIPRLFCIFWVLGHFPRGRWETAHQHKYSAVTPHLSTSRDSVQTIGGYPELGISCLVTLRILHTHVWAHQGVCLWIWIWIQYAGHLHHVLLHHTT